jgi:predicted nuclease of predicted toxin-antitoxin system
MDAAADRLIWQCAEREGVVIVTKDEDFVILQMAHPRQTPQVVWLRIGNTRRSELLHRMEHPCHRSLTALNAVNR